ncbi:MAG: 1-acyl-sn-glycerol-3-phosphate acyltransferase, partial [Lewinella sp.]|nr:1-acyl-sn-glycerol-3-phosphate acyltransferase [Lewinella sp.]
MLYAAVRPLAKIGLQHYFRRIDVAHLDRIPKDAPVILAANHPTAFIEPCILACFGDRPLHFLVRGNLFKKGIYDKLLRSLHMLPVFRFVDGGYEDLKQNYATFAACHEALAQRKTIMILAEGRCIHEKRLRPIRKGTARIAFGTL